MMAKETEDTSKVTRSLYIDSGLINDVEESSLKTGDKNFNREAVRMLRAQLNLEKKQDTK